LDQWDDRETGKKRSKLKVIAESMQFIGPKPQGKPAEPPSAAMRHAQPTAAPAPAKGRDVEPDDIPF
jgi:single-strand DNA-binding protein